jgi:hypothetical protein
MGRLAAQTLQFASTETCSEETRMMRIPIGSVVAATLVLAAACSKSTPRSAEKAQIEADQRRLEAQQQQQQSPNAAAAASAEAERAQRRADQERADAERAFALEKADYVSKIQREVDRNKSTLDDLESARTRAKGIAREAQDRAVSHVTEARRVLDEDMRSIESTTPNEWPGLKAKVDRDIDVYRAAVSDAEGARSKTEPSGASGTPGGRTTAPATPKAGPSPHTGPGSHAGHPHTSGVGAGHDAGAGEAAPR